MLRRIEGSGAIAETVALCRPEVVCAYSVSPQTHIIEAVRAMVKSGRLAPCEVINVESEFAATPVAIGESATGARAWLFSMRVYSCSPHSLLLRRGL